MRLLTDDRQRLTFALVEHILHVAPARELERDGVTGLVDVLELGALPKRGHVIRTRQAIRGSVKRIAGQVADRGDAGPDGLDLVKTARCKGAEGTNVTVYVEGL